ncbi:unnamed protein product, partial [Didymodactylos carnosus]
MVLLIILRDYYAAVTHTFDFSSQMPSKFASMFSMSWFGLGLNDPQGQGSDSYTNHWNVGPLSSCVSGTNPSICSTDYTSSPQRQISSKYRPLLGIYSSSGKDTESASRIDLMLSTIRSSCNTGARLDAWCIQLESIQLSSKYVQNPSMNIEIPYQTFLSFHRRAQAANLQNVIIPGYDSTWLYSFSTYFGLGKCDNSDVNNSRSICLNITIADFIDIVNMAYSYTSSTYFVNSKPVLFIYTSSGGNFLTLSEWTQIFSAVRQKANRDFYTVSTSNLFQEFDAVAPWINYDAWSMTNSTLPLYNRTIQWMNLMYSQLFISVNNYPGRAILGGLTPGFDDYTQGWGACTTRTIPRDTILLQAQFDYFKKQNINRMFLFTWDDYQEGSIFEPDIVNGTWALVTFRQLVGKYFGEEDNSLDEQKLISQWTKYPQIRNCTTIQPSSNLDEFHSLLSKSKSIVVLTGAGVSAESGVPTFRGEGGLWRKYQATDLATPQAFHKNPSLVWEFYHYRRELVQTKHPNPAHYALVEAEKRFKSEGKHFCLITQNVDGLHHRAGSENLLEMHGNLFYVRCTNEKCQKIEENHDSPICDALKDKGAPNPDTKSAEIPVEKLPRCKHCSSLLRPHIVWFGEALWPDVLEKIENEQEKCDLFIV